MRCPVCKRHMKNCIKHHKYHQPSKAEWQRRHPGQTNPTIKVHRKCEQDYHAYFKQFCLDKPCDSYRCRFVNVCYKYKPPHKEVT